MQLKIITIIYIVYSKFKCMKFHVIIFGSKLKFNWNDT